MAYPYPIPPIDYVLTGGINSEDAATSIADNQVVSSTNALWERKMCVARPGAVLQGTLANLTAPVYFGTALWSSIAPYTLYLTTDNKLWVAPGITGTQITGPAFTLQGGATGSQYQNMANVNGAVLIGNLASGTMLRWVAGAGVYTALGGNAHNLRYITSHLSRAVGAFWAGGSASAGPITVEWSKSGDETVWNTSPATDGSGSVILNDAPDSITGLGVIHNVLVILRQTGIHLGFSTGVGLNPYRFETWQAQGSGCYYPATAAWGPNIVAFVGRDDVYLFDLVKMQSVGMSIKSEIQAAMQLAFSVNTFYRGVITYSGLITPRLRYHLFPQLSGLGGATLPHFVLDISEGTWAKCDYSIAGVGYARAAFNAIILGNNKDTLAFVSGDNAPNLFYWDGNALCERPVTIVGKTFMAGSVDRDYMVERALLQHKDFNTFGPASVSVTSRIGKTPASGSDSQQLGSNANDGYWVRTFFNMRVAGNGFQPTISIPANGNFACNLLRLQISEQGQYRG